MNPKPTSYSLLLAILLLFGGCTVDEAGPSLEFPLGNGEPCALFKMPEWFPTPKDINPAHADLHLSFNPNNPNEAIGLRMSSDWSSDSVFIFDLNNVAPPRWVASFPYGASALKWGANDWVLVNADPMQMMKSNGDSLRPIPSRGNQYLQPFGWNPQGDRFFIAGSGKTFFYELDGTLIDSLENFWAFHWYAPDSILGTDRVGSNLAASISIYRPESKTKVYQMPFPQSSNTDFTFQAYYPQLDIQVHPDLDHISILAGNSLWIASLQDKTAKEIMYFCYARYLSDIHLLPNSNRMLVEERNAKQLPNTANYFEYYLVALDRYTGMRLDTLWAFKP